MDPARAQLVTDTWKQAADKLSADLEQRYAQAAARIFTHQELEDIVGFLESSSGQAFMARSRDVWTVTLSDTRGSTLAFIDGWRASYCAQTSCGEAEEKMFTAVHDRAMSLPAAK